MFEPLDYTLRAMLFVAVRAYQRAVSPLLPPACRFVPSCSNYALETLQTWPLLPGLGLILKRVARCQPLCRCGIDPVPPYRGTSDRHRPLSGRWLGLRAESEDCNHPSLIPESSPSAPRTGSETG